MAIKIYVDAASNLFPNIIKDKKLDITLINMLLRVEDKDYNCYLDDIDVENFSKSFYEDIKNGKDVHTSLINPEGYLKAFKDDIEKGNQIICFTMASGISGTYQSACIAQDQINEEQGKTMVHIVDTATAGFGEGLQAIHAAKMVKEGKSFDEIVKEAEEFKWKVRSEFTVDNIKYLAKTGRVNPVLARIVDALRIKVMLRGSYKASIESTGKVPGRKIAIKKLAKQCIEHIKDKDNQTVYISHCDCLEDAEELKSLLEKGGIKNIEVYIYDLITGSHIGPGSLALFYVGENRDL